MRGIAHSFHMPWADILAELQQHAEASDVVDAIPRKPDALKYMIRVHLRVNERSMEKALRQLNVRPYVLLQLLFYLIDHNHKVFRGKGNVEQLRQRMRAAVTQYYPVPEKESEKPEEEQESPMPQDFMDSITIEEIEAPMKKRRLIKEKNATPGDGSRSAEGWLDNQRPSFVASELSTGACSDPATMRTGAILRHGTIFAQTGKELIPQWHSQYFSQILPFVIPYMVFGPDYTFFELRG